MKPVLGDRQMHNNAEKSHQPPRCNRFLKGPLKNPPTPAELLCLRFSWNVDMLLTVGKLTLCILPKIFKMFYSGNKWLFRRNIFGLNVMQFFSFLSNIIGFYIILKLRTPRTQNFLKYRNIFSGSRDIRKRKKSNISLKLRFFENIGHFKKF